MQLVHFTNKVIGHLGALVGAKGKVNNIYIDFAKAFDSVVHAKLLYKLRCIGVNKSLLD